MDTRRPLATLGLAVLVAGLAGAATGQTPPKSKAEVVVKTGRDIPLPHPRPSQAAKPVEALTFEDAIAGLNLDPATITSEPTACDRRLAEIAVVSPRPRLIGPGACGGAEMVELEAVILPDKSRVAIHPVPMLQCRMAESLAAWLRDEVAPRISALGSPLRSVENYDAYQCRGRNNVAGARTSEHGKGNALDLRSFGLADGRRLVPTDMTADKPLREALRDSACRRFSTVLGPGADAHHESHIHLDAIERASGFRICQWDVREPAPVPLPVPRPPAAKIASVTTDDATQPSDADEARLPASKPPTDVSAKTTADGLPPAAGEPDSGARKPTAQVAEVMVPLPPKKPAKQRQIRRKARKSTFPFHLPFTLWR